MPNTFYPKGAEKILRAAINFDTDTIKVGIVSDAYTYSAAHEFLSDAGTLVGTAQTLGTKSTTGGVFDAADPAFGAIAPGSTAKAAVVTALQLLTGIDDTGKLGDAAVRTGLAHAMLNFMHLAKAKN